MSYKYYYDLMKTNWKKSFLGVFLKGTNIGKALLKDKVGNEYIVYEFYQAYLSSWSVIQ